LRVSLVTLGCKVSQYDAANLEERLRRAGADIVPPTPGSQVFLICGCAVTERAARQAGQVARRLQRLNPQASLYYYGCIGSYHGGFAPGQEDALMRALGLRPVPAPTPGQSWHRTRGLVKVQDGCDHDCSFCIVPRLRGPSRSRSPEEVENEVASLVETGFKEVVLTGVHLSSWGLDRPGMSLLDLLRRLDRLPKLVRLRLSSLEPVDLNPDWIHQMGQLEHLCPHLHLPLQSGSDRILGKMGRGYDRAHFLRLAQAARQAWPEVALTTDILIGFPGESEEDFQQTESAIEEIGFARLHLFRYSARPGTPAATFSDQVPEIAKRARMERLQRLSAELPRRFRSQFLGRTFPILVERVEDGLARGFTPNYISLTIPAPPETQVGDIMPAVVGAQAGMERKEASL
jgi:threonylcarbamoyladenosine tRNA methylthiotransferase MtaB